MIGKIHVVVADGQRLGWSEFAAKNSQRSMGQSYSTLMDYDVLRLVAEHWSERQPGHGETGLERKVVVPVPPINFYCPVWSRLVDGLPIKARLHRRQPHEDPVVETYVSEADAVTAGTLVVTPAVRAAVVCYSAEALSENGGERYTDCEWEIVTILCYDEPKDEPMPPITMARNYLQKPGGTFTDYTAKQFAEAIYFHSTSRRLRVLS